MECGEEVGVDSVRSEEGGVRSGAKAIEN